jgi:hypothetical protein
MTERRLLTIFFPVGVEQRRPTQIMCSITQSAKSIDEERPIAIAISIRKKRPLYLQYQVKFDNVKFLLTLKCILLV